MFRFVSITMRPAKNVGRVLFSGTLSVLLAASWMVPTFSQSKNRPVSQTQAMGKPDPDALLIEVYKDLAANHLRDAQAKADALVAAYPNFQLGHLIRGDLLLMHARPVTTFGAVKDGPADKLKDLRAEAMVRLRALRERPAPDSLPRSILQLRDDQKHVLIVDTKRSRLYVYQNQNGQPKLVSDYYVTQGKLGINKIKEGDQKTPIGVYYITGHLPGAKLPDLYGIGALPINYPNEWDKVNGRSGSGIWLHGTPAENFSRPPLASDGCVVLTNQDLRKLLATVEIGKTPVVISEQVEFISKSAWNAERNSAGKLLDGWQHDVESLNPTRLMSHYSNQFKSELGEDLKTWFAKRQLALNGISKLSLKLRDVALFRYPGRDDMLVTTFTQDSQFDKKKSSLRKRQYWAKEGSQWKIVYESNN